MGSSTILSSRATGWVTAALAVAITTVPRPAPATGVVQWTPNGVALCAAAGNQQNPQIVPDGAGGVIVAWQDARGGASDIYAQRLRADGTVSPGWPANGLALCTAAFSQANPQLVSDGAGGAIVTWQDGRAGANDIYAQRALAAGTVDPGWPANGVAVCSAAGAQGLPQLVADGAGGAIVTWQDSRGTTSDIYAQHVLASGAVDPGWTADGVALCTAARVQSNPRIAPDGAGGAIVTWHDARGSGPSADIYDIYAQRVLATGTIAPGWPANGVGLCTAASSQLFPAIVADGAGGAIVTWYDRRSGQPIDPIFQDIYAQRVDGAGVQLWTPDGIALCLAVSTQANPQIASDGAGGALVVWQDHRSGTYDIYAHHALANGTLDPGLPADGVAVCTSAGSQENPQIVADGAGGAIVTWQDAPSGTNYHIYAQRLVAGGGVDPSWPAPGVALCTAGGTQVNPQIAADGAGGAIVTWQDSRAGGTNPLDIYAQRITGDLCQGIGAPGLPSCGVVDWTSAAGGLFSDIANWNGGSGPVPSGACPATCTLYDARFGIGGAAYPVGFAGGPASARVAIEAGDHATFDLAGNTYRIGELDLDGAGSSLSIAGGAVVVGGVIQVGLTPGATPALEIAGDGAAFCDSARIGTPNPRNTATGHVTVRAGGKWRVDGALTVGGPETPGFPNGVLDLEDGCTVCAQSLTLAPRAQVNARALIVSGTGFTSCPSTPLPQDGRVTATSVGGVFMDTLRIGAEAAVESVLVDRGGVLFGAAPIPRDLMNSGTLSPGADADGVGALELNADYTQTPDGTLVVDLGGDAPGAGYDVVRVAGAATLGGALKWKLVGGYLPAIGKTFEVLVAHPRIGVFDAVGADIGVSYTDTSVVLTATATTPALASLVSAEAEPGRVEVRWHVSGAEGPVTIRRDHGTGAWEAVDHRFPDGTGMVGYVDTDVVAGRYGYRLGLPAGSGETAAGEVWVEVPVASRFALGGVSPNPASGPLRVSFSLGSAEPARLELFDLVGRRLATRAIESPRPGARVLTLATGGAPAPGVYLLQLSQGARRATSRVAIVR